MRVMQSRISFGRKGRRLDIAHYEYFERMQLWNVKDDPNQPALDEQFDTVIHLSPKFWKDLQEHPIPLDMNVIRELSAAPGILDLVHVADLALRQDRTSLWRSRFFGEYGHCTPTRYGGPSTADTAPDAKALVSKDQELLA